MPASARNTGMQNAPIEIEDSFSPFYTLPNFGQNATSSQQQ
jgi:hypothetical protein